MITIERKKLEIFLKILTTPESREAIVLKSDLISYLSREKRLDEIEEDNLRFVDLINNFFIKHGTKYYEDYE